MLSRQSSTHTSFRCVLAVGLSGAMVACFAALPASALSAPAAHAPVSPTSNTTIASWAREVENHVVAGVNAYRVANGVPALTRDGQIDAVARSWSETQARQNQMSHNHSYFEQMPAGATSGAENVAYGNGPGYSYGSADAKAVADRFVQNWINSDGHRKNLLNAKYTHTGVGVASSAGGTVYATQNFGAYSSSLVPAPVHGWYLSNTFGSAADVFFTFGDPGDVGLVGDWDGNRTDTAAIRRGITFYVRNSNTSGPADFEFSFGNPGDQVLIGDWDSNRTDTPAVRRGITFYVRNTTTTGVADKVFSYGNPGDEILIGDWDGNGSDTITVRRGNTFYVRNSLTTGVADKVFSYGNPGDEILIGDWDGNGTDTITVRRGITYYISNSNSTGVAAKVVAYGNLTDQPLAGDWNGDGTDSIGVHR